MRLFLNNIESKEQKGPYMINSITDGIENYAKNVKNKDWWIIRIYDDDKQCEYMYNLNGDLLYKEYEGTVKIDGNDIPETLCHDYSINENIKNGTIVKCSIDNNYYIMTDIPNHANIANSAKFVGINDYPDDYTIWGVPQYFLTIVNEEDIAKKKLGYLYELQKLFNAKKWEELYTLRCKLEEL